jgi:NADH-quinone oxidoreductase subunit M
MLSPDQIRSLLPWLLLLPLLAAVLLPLLGKTTASARRIALGVALLHLVLTGLIVESARVPLAERKAVGDYAPQAERDKVFVPQFVPGDRGTVRTDANGQSTRVDINATSWTLVPIAKPGDPKMQGIQFFIGLDGLNIWLIALTSLMMVPVILISWESIQIGAGKFYAWLFALQAGVLGVFLAFDVILFYVCFELTLIPLFFLISAWGTGASRREAARKLFLFTLAGGLITLLGIVAAVASVHERMRELTFSIPRLAELMQIDLSRNGESALSYWRDRQYYIFLAIAIGFMVKIPLVPLHSWLPGAYSEAPIGVTVMLSALLAKMGTFGLLRICLPLAPDGTLAAGLPVVGTLAAIGIIYGALCAYAQTDFKRMAAYSSVSHLGFCALALVAFNAEGMAGGLLHMVNHGLSTGALFLLIGFLLQRYSSGQMKDFSGLWNKLPVLTFFMMVICLASIGLPGLCNFVSEMLMLGGLFDLRNARAAGITLAVIAALGIFLSAWYLLTMLQRVFFNELKEPAPAHPGEVKDLNGRELAIIAPLAALCLFIGCCPQYLIDPMKRDVETLARIADDARRDRVPLPPPPQPTNPVPKKQPVKKKDAKTDTKKVNFEVLPKPREVAPAKP